MSVSKKNKDVIIAAGGTGGHVFSGIAIAEEMRRADPSVRICFAGTARGLESSIMPKLGWPLMLVGAHSIKDKRGIRRIMAWLNVPFSIARALAILLSKKPSLVVSIGGYAAGPLVVAAWILWIPVALVEPNAIPGMTNRMLGRFAKKVFITFEQAKGFFAKKKTMLTGTPLRKEVLETTKAKPAFEKENTLFVFGGSQGAMTLNRAMIGAASLLKDIAGGVKVIHQVGANSDLSKIEAAYKTAGIEAEVMPFCDRIWECYEKADMVIARSGAITIAEVSALGIPSILVPYPYAADDHQRANAKALVNAGGAVLIEDSECTGERLAQEIANMLGDSKNLKSMGEAAASFGKRDAAKRIADESLKLTN
ncbi:MAG: undecaprenyldiphospho-muramoylpentapeptide beta-N-acetylglucosaminyltransferase [Pseudomonadota bacterium]